MFFSYWRLGVFALNGVETKEDHQMEMRWCLIALKSLCRFLLFGMCVLRWTQDDCVARKLPKEVRLTEISQCNDRRMCNNADK
jgi:hypothetical protein